MKLEEFSRALGEAPWAFEYRREAEKRMHEMQLPNFKYGEKILLKPGIDLSAVKLSQTPSMHLAVKSQDGLEILHDKGFSAIPVQLFSRFTFSNNSWFSNFNEAYTSSFVFVRVPTAAKLGVSFFKLDFSSLPAAASVFVLAEKDSQSTIVLEASGKSDVAQYLGLNVKVLAEEGSQVTLVGIQDFSKNTFCFEERSAFAEKDAVVNWVSLSVGARYHSAGVVSQLAEEGASTNMRCLYAASGDQRYDLFTKAIHDAPHTKSNILTRGVVSGNSKALSRGLIAIASGAPGSFGFEKQDALILSEDAEADAIPNLEIENYDVKCSHGSTVGQINPEELFYLMSRGLTEDDAKRLIIHGYFNPILAMFDGEAREELEGVLERAIG